MDCGIIDLAKIDVVYTDPLSGVLPLVGQGNASERAWWNTKSWKPQAKTFPQFGSTLSYLLTADYLYTGLVKSPSLDDMTDALIWMNSGGISGLESVGLLPIVDGKKSSMDEKSSRQPSSHLSTF
jgi:hypothetical protein